MEAVPRMRDKGGKDSMRGELVCQSLMASPAVKASGLTQAASPFVQTRVVAQGPCRRLRSWINFSASIHLGWR